MGGPSEGSALGFRNFWVAGPRHVRRLPYCSEVDYGHDCLPRLAWLAVGVFVSGEDFCVDASAGTYFKTLFPRPLADRTGFVYGRRSDLGAGSSPGRCLLSASCGVTREGIAQFLGMVAV